MIRFEFTGHASGAENMAADVGSAMDALRGREYPHVRFYQWNPAAISLGAHQPTGFVTERFTSMHGIDIVKRPTGGGAILHTDELTYCMTLAIDTTSPTAVYDRITRALLAGLHALGISADGEMSSQAGSSAGNYAHEPICFSGIARYEIRVRTRKLVGSAQRVYRGDGGRIVVLQHGSILLSDAHSLLPVYLSGDSRSELTETINTLRRRSTSVVEELGYQPAMNDIVEAMRQGFMKMFGMSASDRPEPTAELKEVLP